MSYTANLILVHEPLSFLLAVKGARKVAVMMKRGGGMMQEHMLTMINDCNLIDHTHPEERGKWIAGYSWAEVIVKRWYIEHLVLAMTNVSHFFPIHLQFLTSETFSTIVHTNFI